MRAVFVMVRKRRTELPSGGESSEAQHPSERSAPPPQQQAAAAAPGGAGPQGGRGWGPQGGRGGGRSRGMPQQQYGAPPDYQGRGRGGPSQQGGRGGYGSGRSGGGGGMGSGRGVGPSYGGPSRPPAPELHQATSVQSYQTGVSSQPASSEASSSLPPEPIDLEQSMGQMVLHSEPAPTPPPASKSSMRFPLRPGKGSYGTKCVVKANHFFAELPNKDLHQYDVSSNFDNDWWKNSYSSV